MACVCSLISQIFRSIDFFPHNLLIAKLNAYCFDNKTMRFVHDYLAFHKQTTKISGMTDSSVV